MQLSHLKEITHYQSLLTVWKSEYLEIIIDVLSTGNEEAIMLGIILTNAKRKSNANPEKLFDFVNPLIDISTHLNQYGKSEYALKFTLKLFLQVLVECVLKMDEGVQKRFISKIDVDEVVKYVGDQLADNLKTVAEQMYET